MSKKQLVVVRATGLDLLFPELSQSISLKNVSLSGEVVMRSGKGKRRGKKSRGK